MRSVKRDDLVPQSGHAARAHAYMHAFTHNTHKRGLATSSSSSPVRRHLSLRTISSKKHEAKRRLTRQVKNSSSLLFYRVEPNAFFLGWVIRYPSSCKLGKPIFAELCITAVPFPRCPPANRPTRIPMSSSSSLASASETATHSTRVRRQREHFLVQVLTAACKQGRGKGVKGKRGLPCIGNHMQGTLATK